MWRIRATVVATAAVKIMGLGIWHADGMAQFDPDIIRLTSHETTLKTKNFTVPSGPEDREVRKLNRGTTATPSNLRQSWTWRNLLLRFPVRLEVEGCFMERQSVIASDPDILGGTPCFRGTRVPVDSLIDYLEAGDTLDEFLDNFPSVSRDAAITALEEAKSLLTNSR